MTEPMTAEAARAMAADLQNGKADEREIAATLRVHADMLDRQTVDREAIDEIVCEAYFKGVSVGKNVSNAFSFTPLTDRILALMPAAPVVARELEWKGEDWFRGSFRRQLYTADCGLASYSIRNSEDCWSAEERERRKTLPWYLITPGARPDTHHPTLEAAKAAAQAHYNDAIAKAVKPAHVTETPKTEHVSEPCYSGERDGMVMVPREPTEAMIEAGAHAYRNKWADLNGDAGHRFGTGFADAYRAMIEAAKGDE